MVLSDGPGRPPAAEIRAALYQWAFNSSRRKEGPPPEVLAGSVHWIERNSKPLSDLEDLSILRRVLDGLAVNLSGRPAAATVVARRRAVPHRVLRYAIERGHLVSNPLDRLRWKAPRVAEAVDRRSVVNHDQAKQLLAAVGAQGEASRPFVAFFGCMYYGALRPAEVSEVREADLVLPITHGDWGDLHLNCSNPVTSKSWTDTGAREARQLKHRGVREVRIVPCAPPLSRLLAEHLAEFGTAPDGRLFRGVRGGPVSDTAYGDIWQEARRRALTAAGVASPLAARPYDLRQAGCFDVAQCRRRSHPRGRAVAGRLRPDAAGQRETAPEARLRWSGAVFGGVAGVGFEPT